MAYAGNGGRGGHRSGERPARKRRSFLWRWRRAFFLVALFGLACVAAGATAVARTELPELDPLQQSTFICAQLAEGDTCRADNAMAKLSTEDRVSVNYEDLSPHIINAVVAMEDRNFFEHDGVAPLAIARALYRDLRGDGVQQGGSTITQQYVKNAFLSPERTLDRKIREAVLSIKLEQRMTKEEILEAYLNTIYFGRGAYGVQAAGQAYFGVNAGDLDIGQAAYLAGLIRAPEYADASRDLEEAERRRHTALVAMEEEGYITADELALYDAVEFVEPYFRARTERREMQVNQGAEFGTDYITAYVRRLLQEKGYSDDEILRGGLRVYTSLDLDMQQRAWNAVEGVLNQPGDPPAGMVAIDEQGLIRAMVGGHDYEADPDNYAVPSDTRSGRPVGSTYKPIALAEAVSQNYSVMSEYDAPGEKTIDQSSLPGCEPEWTLGNYAESEQGRLNLVEATAQSSNTAYAQLMVDLTPQAVTDMATQLGMPGEPSAMCPSLVLGTDNATPLDMATIYSVFANRGVRKDPAIITRIERVDEDGNVTVLEQWAPSEGERVLAPQQADLVSYALQQVMEGTGHNADIGRPAAGKTGTSSDNRDAWFVGYVPRLTAAVWMGYPDADWVDPETQREVVPPMNQDGRPVHDLRSVTGGSLPAQIWHDFMLGVTESRGMNDTFPEVTQEMLEQGQRLETLHGDVPGGGDGDGGDGDGGDQDDDTEPAPSSTTTRPDDGGPQPTRPGSSTTSSSTSTSSTTTSSSTTSTTEPDDPDPTEPGGPPWTGWQPEPDGAGGG